MTLCVFVYESSIHGLTLSNMSRHIKSEWHENNTVRPQTKKIETVRCWEYHHTMRLMMSSFLLHSLCKRMNVNVDVYTCVSISIFVVIILNVSVCLLAYLFSYCRHSKIYQMKNGWKRRRIRIIITITNGNRVNKRPNGIQKDLFKQSHGFVYSFLLLVLNKYS